MLDQQESRLARGIGLHVGGHFDPVIVGHHQADFDLADLPEIGHLVVDAGPEVAGDVIGQRHRVGTAGLQQTAAHHATLDERLDLRVLHTVDEDLLAQDQRAAPAILGGIVRQAHYDPLHVTRIEPPAQNPAQRIVVEGHGRVLVKCRQVRASHLDKVPHVHRSAQPQELGEDRLARRSLIPA